MINQAQLKPDDVELLRSLIGQKYRFIGGINLEDDLVSDHVVVFCEFGSLAITGDTYEDAFEGFDETYSSLVIQAAKSSDEDAIRKAGLLFKQNMNQVVDDVLRVDERVTLTERGETVWTHTTTVSLVFVLSSGFTAVTKLGHHDEMLKVTFGEVFDLDLLPSTLGGFEQSIHQSYDFRRFVSSIAPKSGE